MEKLIEKMENLILQKTNFEMLKQAVFKLAQDGKLLGVSLKKVSDNANAKELNIPNQRMYNQFQTILIFLLDYWCKIQ